MLRDPLLIADFGAKFFELLQDVKDYINFRNANPIPDVMTRLAQLEPLERQSVGILGNRQTEVERIAETLDKFEEDVLGKYA